MNHNTGYHSLPISLLPKLAFLLIMLSSCQMLESGLTGKEKLDPHSQQQANQEEQIKDQALIRTINMHLTLAELAMQELRLTTPAQGSALHHYKAVLLLQNNHPDAIKGISHIIDQYLSWSLTHIKDDQYSAARRLLDKAYLVDPLAPEVAAMAELLEISRQTKTEIIVIPDWILGEQEETESEPPIHVITYFQDIAAEIRKKHAAITLYSRNDVQGRWLYQHINSNSDTRIRAILKMDSPTRIELHYQPQSEAGPIIQHDSGGP
jgi:hypothetical protein